jgi:hypothetical protein
MRRSVTLATAALYSEHFDMDDVLRRLADTNDSDQLLFAYIAIQVATNLSTPISAGDIAYGLKLLGSASRDALSLNKELAELGWSEKAQELLNRKPHAARMNIHAKPQYIDLRRQRRDQAAMRNGRSGYTWPPASPKREKSLRHTSTTRLPAKPQNRHFRTYSMKSKPKAQKATSILKIHNIGWSALHSQSSPTGGQTAIGERMVVCEHQTRGPRGHSSNRDCSGGKL